MSCDSTPACVELPETHEPRICLSSVMPYFVEADHLEAAAALADNRLSDAMAAFDGIAETFDDAEMALRAAFVSAYLAYYTGDDDRALAELPDLAVRLPLLSDVAFEVAALAAMRRQLFPLAVRYAEEMRLDPLTRQMIVADARRRQGHLRDALETYRDILRTWPESERSREAQSRMVECVHGLTDTGRPDPDAFAAEMTETLWPLEREALDIIQNLVLQHPTDVWTRHATGFENGLLDRIGEASDDETEEPYATPSKRREPQPRRETRRALKAYEDASADMQRRNNARAEKRYAEAIRLARRGGDLYCRARHEQALVVRYQRDHGRAGDLFREVARECKQPDILRLSLYRAGQAFMSASRHEDAIAMFAQVEELFSDHSYADDARLHGARAHLALGRNQVFLEMLQSLPDLYPDGDMRAEALWVAAKWAIDRNQYDTALNTLQRYFELFPIESGWYTAGRSGYWLGRVQELTGNIDDAISRYEYVIATTPLSFYMVMAFNRLKALDGIHAVILIDQLAPDTEQTPSEIPLSLLTTPSAFSTGMELVRLGLISRGRKMIEDVLRQPDSHRDLHRAAAALFRNKGVFSDARGISSRAADGWETRYPVGADNEIWTLAYPRAFETFVDFAATESGVDRALLWAVMREESSFNETIESWANAIGLMQLILPTARAMGRTLDLTVNRQTLRDPQVNIRLGAAYLADLKRQLNGHPALMIAGYNAGGGAASRWQRNNGHLELDLFIESIPYSQTRGYTKRVLSTYAVYRFLYEESDRMLTLPFRVAP